MRTGGNTAAPRAAHSQALDLLRFPLAVVVLTVHAFGIQGVQVYGEYHDFMSIPTYEAVYYFVMSFLAEYSLAIYFFISGYVFFLGVDDFTLGVWKRKLRNRLKTLLIPFIVWNVLAAMVEVAYFYPPLSALRPGLDAGDLDFSIGAVLQIFWDNKHGITAAAYPPGDGGAIYPADSPLWFLRALMFMSLLAPALHYLIKRLKFYFVAAAYLVWFCVYIADSGVDKGVALEVTTALFAFSLGAYMSIFKKDMLAVFGRYFRLSAVAYVALSVVQMAAYYCGASTLQLAAKALAVPAAMVFAYNLSAWLLRRKWCRVVPLLASASFFVYVAHKIFLTNIVKAMVYIIGPESQFAVVGVYVAVVVLETLALLGVFWLMQRYTPRLLKFATGRK